MALPASGTLAITEIATEFGDTAPHAMSEFYRGGGKVPDSAGNSSVPTSGAINVGGFYNAANRVALALTIASNTQNYDVYTQASASPSYVAGVTDLTVTVNPGIVVGSSTTGSYAMSVPSSFTSGDTVTIVNNGTVIGRGGNGGRGGPRFSLPITAGGTGGNALYANYTTVFTNNGTLSGAGGGGGGGRSGYGQGGGGGGGAGNTAGSGGAGGASPLPGSPGGSGSLTSGGGGGASYPGPPGAGGAGGGQGANGGAGGGSQYGPGAAGGTRGFYLVGSSNVTFPATGTRLGQVS